MWKDFWSICVLSNYIFRKGLRTSTKKSCIFSAFQQHSFPGFQVVGWSNGTFLKCSTCVLGGLKSNGVVSTLLVWNIACIGKHSKFMNEFMCTTYFWAKKLCNIVEELWLTSGRWFVICGFVYHHHFLYCQYLGPLAGFTTSPYKVYKKYTFIS